MKKDGDNQVFEFSIGLYTPIYLVVINHIARQGCLVSTEKQGFL